MKKVSVTTAIMVMTFVSLSAMSCKDTKKDHSEDAMHSKMKHDKVMNYNNLNTSNDMVDNNVQT